eukprot:3803640-Prymnesium_polylepis.1
MACGLWCAVRRYSSATRLVTTTSTYKYIINSLYGLKFDSIGAAVRPRSGRIDFLPKVQVFGVALRPRSGRSDFCDHDESDSGQTFR